MHTPKNQTRHTTMNTNGESKTENPVGEATETLLYIGGKLVGYRLVVDPEFSAENPTDVDLQFVREMLDDPFQNLLEVIGTPSRRKEEIVEQLGDDRGDDFDDAMEKMRSIFYRGITTGMLEMITENA